MYQLTASGDPRLQPVMLHREDGAIIGIPVDPANTDYQAYLAWLGEGNIPEPAPPPTPEPDWLGFNTEMFLDKDWSSYINPPLLMAAATSAALSRDIAQLQYCLELAYQTVGEPSEAARTRWNNLAQRFHIGVTF